MMRVVVVVVVVIKAMMTHLVTLIGAEELTITTIMTAATHRTIPTEEVNVYGRKNEGSHDEYNESP